MNGLFLLTRQPLNPDLDFHVDDYVMRGCVIAVIDNYFHFWRLCHCCGNERWCSMLCV
jgi:hypothetical protein